MHVKESSNKRILHVKGTCSSGSAVLLHRNKFSMLWRQYQEFWIRYYYHLPSSTIILFFRQLIISNSVIRYVSLQMGHAARQSFHHNNNIPHRLDISSTGIASIGQYFTFSRYVLQQIFLLGRTIHSRRHVPSHRLHIIYAVYLFLQIPGFSSGYPERSQFYWISSRGSCTTMLFTRR